MWRLRKSVSEMKSTPYFVGQGAYVPIVPAPLAHESFRMGEPYPIKSLFCGGGNPTVNMQNTKSVWNSLKNNLELLLFLSSL